MTVRSDNNSKALRTCPKNALLRFFRAVSDILLGRVGMPVYLRGRRETLYPCMNRREVRLVADEICRRVCESFGT